MDRLSSMAAFVKAVELGSFAAAGEALELSGPMIGKHVRSLEQRMGVRLLNRTTRAQSLTEFGRIYFDRCRSILADVGALELLAEDQSVRLRGRLRVTMPVHFGRLCVAPVLTDFARRHPELELELSFADRLVDLAEGDYDLAIRTGALADRAEVMARRVARQRMTICAAPSYLHEHGTPTTPSAIGNHPCVVYRRAGVAAPWRFPDADGQCTEIVVQGRLCFDDLDAIATAAAAGSGLAWLPSWLIRRQIEDGTLVEISVGRPDFPYDVHAMWLHTPHMPAKVRRAIDELSAELPRLM